jgi:hypothetical protein
MSQWKQFKDPDKFEEQLGYFKNKRDRMGWMGDDVENIWRQLCKFLEKSRIKEERNNVLINHDLQRLMDEESREEDVEDQMEKEQEENQK